MAKVMAASCGAAMLWVLVALLLLSREALSLRHRLLPKTVHNSAPIQGYNYQTKFFDQKVWLRIHEVCARGFGCHALVTGNQEVIIAINL